MSTNLTVLIAAICGGISAGAAVVIIFACWRRYRKKQPPKFSRNIRRRKIVPPSPVPKPDVRTADLTGIDQSQLIAANYVEAGMRRPKTGGHSPTEQPPASRELRAVQQPPKLSPRKALQVSSGSSASPLGHSRDASPDPLSSVYPNLPPYSSPRPRLPYGPRSSATEMPEVHRFLETRASAPDNLIASPPPLSPGFRHRVSFQDSDESSGLGTKRATRFSKFISIDGSGEGDLASLATYGKPVAEGAESPEEDSGNRYCVGHLMLRLEYQYDHAALRFRPIRVKNLKTTGPFTGSTEFFLKVSLVSTNELPADGKVSLSKTQYQWKSKTYQSANNPVFDAEDHHDFPCSTARLAKMGFLVYVFGHSRYSPDSIIGHVWLPLTSQEATHRRALWRDIHDGARIIDYAAQMDHGSIQFSLLYQALYDRITVVVRKAMRLTADSTTYTSTLDPYVSVQLNRHGHRVMRKSTPILKSTAQPVFNAPIRFERVSTAGKPKEGTIQDCGVLVVVRNKTRVGSNQVIGAVLASKVTNSDSGQHHWSAMLESEGTAVERWHSLGAKPGKRFFKLGRMSVIPVSSDESSDTDKEEETEVVESSFDLLSDV